MARSTRLVMLIQAHCPANLDPGPAIQLHRSLALSRSRSLALFPAPLREVSAAPWSAELSLDLSRLILAVILNKPRSLPRLICQVNFLRNFFSLNGALRVSCVHLGPSSRM